MEIVAKASRDLYVALFSEESTFTYTASPGGALIREVTRARRTASADWWITPGTAGMRPQDLFTTSRDYRESVGVIFH
ncbi:hypothetical protein EVAR_67094_1 [Eumeta japonica]|uniref:Uncharacterized protein n=1 Tax=Eumeta variegata TaxID=151549 RepID=A0A4C1ZS13_EUMVA|nr:hypothetical protein EVAR_67094_1 [Eumeta japonica]